MELEFDDPNWNFYIYSLMRRWQEVRTIKLLHKRCWLCFISLLTCARVKKVNYCLFLSLHLNYHMLYTCHCSKAEDFNGRYVSLHLLFVSFYSFSLL